MEKLQIIIIEMIGITFQLWKVVLLMTILGLILNPLIEIAKNVINSVINDIRQYKNRRK